MASEAIVRGLDRVLFMPGAVFGLVYAGIAGVDRVAPLAAEPRTGVVLGLGFGILFWLTTVLGGSLGVGRLFAGLVFGAVIGLLYALSPYVE